MREKWQIQETEVRTKAPEKAHSPEELKPLNEIEECSGKGSSEGPIQQDGSAGKGA